MYNTCRTNGVQGAHVDFLICAVARSHSMGILTTDRDFEHFAEHLEIKLLNG